MSKNSNKKKSQQLGMPHGTACGKLRKQIMFNMMQRCEMDTCHQCGDKIETAEELSIEHKTPWLDSEDPVGLFFNMDNIAFSHHSCNSGAARKVMSACPSYQAYRRGCRCDGCKLKSREYQKKKYAAFKASKDNGK